MRSIVGKENQNYFFTTSVSSQSEKDEFLLDFYPIVDNMIQKSPIRTTKNFDELIGFLEEI